MEKVLEVISIKQETREISERYQWIPQTQITSPDDVGRIAINLIGNEDREVFLVIVVNTKHKVVAIHKAHLGSINVAIVSPREVFKAAILNNGARIFVAHNHPSYDLAPSREDIEVTKRLVDCGKILDIEVLDHLIVGDKKYNSLKEKGYM